MVITDHLLPYKAIKPNYLEFFFLGGGGGLSNVVINGNEKKKKIKNLSRK